MGNSHQGPELSSTYDKILIIGVLLILYSIQFESFILIYSIQVLTVSSFFFHWFGIRCTGSSWGQSFAANSTKNWQVLETDGAKVFVWVILYVVDSL